MPHPFEFTLWRMQAIAQALLEGECFSTTVATTITAETGASFEVIEGCERGDFSSGDASGSTDGSTAEGVCTPPTPPPPSICACIALTTSHLPPPNVSITLHRYQGPPAVV